MTKKAKPMSLRPIGYVKSSYRDTFTIPLGGSRAHIVVERGYARALLGVKDHSHLYIICWLHLADTEGYRKILRVRPVRVAPDLPEQGVFASRSPMRPNPLSLTIVRLIRVRGNVLTVDGLDTIDGTPVIDIKPYSPVGDSYPRATAYGISMRGHEDYLSRAFYREAVNFHGEECREVAIGARMIVEGLSKMGLSYERDPEIEVTCLKAGCLADAVQSIMGATVGGGRLRIYDKRRQSLIFHKGRKVLRVGLNPRFKLPRGRVKAIEAALATKVDELLVFG
jgi:tRNA-Thr(GGU) m(6)t(6)A37 methyltransferase TsaA